MTLYYLKITTSTDKLSFKMQYNPRKLFKAAYGSRSRARQDECED